jgi:hypothetical protein
VWKGSLGPEDFDEPVYHFSVETREISPKSVHFEDMIIEKKIDQNIGMVRTA